MAWQFNFAQFRRTFVALIALVFIILVSVIFNQEIYDLYHPLGTYTYCKVAGTIDNKQGLKRILFYTPWFGHTPWPLQPELSIPCSHKCLITYNKCELQYSNAVIFHEPDISYGTRALKRIAAYLGREPLQRWVYYTHENPHNANHDPNLYNGIFNWTVTYRTDSDVVYPYKKYKAIQSVNEIPKEHFTTNYAKGKDKLIVWAVSHCGVIRDKVVQNLLQYLPVTVIGSCSKLFNQVSPKICKTRSSSSDCSSYLKTFKFYLAFENGMCIDYVTEKYWGMPFNNNMVPIVLGSNYDANVAIPGSFINAMDFSSMKALSNYIKYLDKNDTAYNEYFSWKAKYKVTDEQNSWLCKLCVKLYNDSMPKKVYTNLGAYWGVESNCHKNEWKIRRLLK